MPATLSERADVLAQRIVEELEGTIPLLSHEQAKQQPVHPDGYTDVDIAATRVARMLHLLQAARVLGHQHLGTALASVARAMWDTWFDLAWLLHDPSLRVQRAEEYAVAGFAQQVGVLRMFYQRDGFLAPHLAEALKTREAQVQKDPGRYTRWFNTDGQLTKSVHSIRWPPERTGVRARQMGPMYERAYDIDYTLLSAPAHGQGLELPRLIERTTEGTRIALGEGEEAATALLVESVGIALTLVYEIQRAYLGGAYSLSLDLLRDSVAQLRAECQTLI